MKRLDIKVNYILNFVRIISATLVGLIMMPYVNKILGANVIGKVEYANTIINYFLMFSAIGVPIYGVREIAKVRNNLIERSRLTFELFIILFFTTIVSYILLFFILIPFPFFSDYKSYIIILSSMILLTNIGADWYFQGMENQIYITIRYSLVRILTIVLLFLFVKTKEDILIYCFLLVLNLAGSNVFNIIFIFKSLSFNAVSFSDLDFKRHFTPLLKIFIATISINIYVQLDNFLIGLLAGDKYLAYYTVPNKLIRYAISFITMAGIILLPKISRLWESDKEGYYQFLKISFEIILLLSVPFTGYFLIFSPFIVHLMAGKDFYPSILTMEILSPLCIVVGIAYFFGYLLLYTQKKESIYTIAVLSSAFLSVVLNIWMIKSFKQNGAAITQVIAECLAIIYMMFMTRNQLSKLKLSFLNIGKSFLATFIACVFCYFISHLFEKEFFSFSVLSLIYFLLIGFVLIIFKERNVKNIIYKAKIFIKMSAGL